MPKTERTDEKDRAESEARTTPSVDYARIERFLSHKQDKMTSQMFLEKYSDALVALELSKMSSKNDTFTRIVDYGEYFDADKGRD